MESAGDVPGPARDGPSRYARQALLAVAGVLALAAFIAAATGGGRLAIGPLRLSATEPTRILLEAAAVWLLAGFVPSSKPRPWQRRLVPVLALIAAAVLDSAPRRVGDGHEYLVMAMRIGRGQSPALSRIDREEAGARLAAMPGFEDAVIGPGAVGRDGREDFLHFWLYPLVASPVAAVADAAGVHPNHAFTLVNALLFLLLLGWLMREERHDAAALLAAGPVLWWIDKAHAEVFIFVMLAFAVLLAVRSPLLALGAAALACAQNPAAAIVLAACIAGVALSGRWRTVSAAGMSVVLAIAALAPAYYLWRLGRPSPLLSTVEAGIPGVRALLTPLIDPNLGLLPHAPVLVLLGVAGVVRVPRTVLLTIGAAAVGLLVVFAQVGNVNHGGTPGMSRYSLWLLALMVPLIAEGCVRARARSAAAVCALAAVSIALSLYAFRPAWADRAGNSANLLAGFLWTHWPAADNPLPEVFAERTFGADGGAELPVATAGCEKVLTLGDGADAWWPAPCSPGPLPAECSLAGALCYANNGVFAAVPLQRHFGFEPGLEHAVTARNPQRLQPVLRRLGEDAQFVRRGGARRVDDSMLDGAYIVEGRLGTVAWVRTPETARESSIHVRLEVPSRIELLDAGTLALDRALGELPVGAHTIDLPASSRLIVVIVTR